MKIRCPQGRRGSNPLSRTKFFNKMKYKAGKYKLDTGQDLFSPNKESYHVTVSLTEEEAKNLFQTNLFHKLGFFYWSYIGEK